MNKAIFAFVGILFSAYSQAGSFSTRVRCVSDSGHTTVTVQQQEDEYDNLLLTIRQISENGAQELLMSDVPVIGSTRESFPGYTFYKSRATGKEILGFTEGGPDDGVGTVKYFKRGKQYKTLVTCERFGS